MTGSLTPFAGLELLEPADPLSTNHYRFQSINPSIIDLLLKIGCVTHKHDGLPGLTNPASSLSFATASTGGSLPASTTYYASYTLVDSRGGETLHSAAEEVTTAALPPDPKNPPALAAKYDEGVLLSNNYTYGVTVTDGEGGESALSPVASVFVEPGFPNARVLVTNLKSIREEVMGASPTAEFRLWRAAGGGPFVLIAQGKGSEVNDDGTLVENCTVEPPEESTMNGTNEVSVKLPAEGFWATAVALRLYISTDEAFPSPSFLQEFVIAEAGTTHKYKVLTLVPGEPPQVSTSVTDANKIDPDTEILDFHWKRPVKKTAELPTEGEGTEEGDVRLVLEEKKIYAFDGETKEWYTPSGSSGVHFVDTATFSVPGEVSAGNVPGPFVRTNSVGPSETQYILGVMGTVGKGKCKVTLKKNGVAVVGATAITLKEGEVTNKFTEEVFLETGDYLDLVIEAPEAGTEQMRLSVFIEHFTTG